MASPYTPGQTWEKVPQTILASLYTTTPYGQCPYRNNTFQKGASLTKTLIMFSNSRTMTWWMWEWWKCSKVQSKFSCELWAQQWQMEAASEAYPFKASYPLFNQSWSSSGREVTNIMRTKKETKLDVVQACDKCFFYIVIPFHLSAPTPAEYSNGGGVTRSAKQLALDTCARRTHSIILYSTIW